MFREDSMPNRCWPCLRLLALLVLLVLMWTMIPQPAAAQGSAPQLQAHAYDCTVLFGDFNGDWVTCNGVALTGDKHFYAARIAPGQTVSISATVSKLPNMIITGDTAYLQITSASGAVSGWHRISKLGTVSWTNTTGVAQDLKLIWKSNGPIGRYRVQGSVQVF
jgi:hypothetical protein